MRERVFLLLDAGHSEEPMARFVDLFLISLISLNVVAVIFESMPEVYTEYGPWFDAFEIFSVGVFTVEYVLRVWSSVESRNPRYKSSFKGRVRFMLSPLALIDLIVLLPFYLSSLFGVDLRMLRALRLLRAFRLTRYANSMNLLLQVLRDEGPVISAALFVLLMMITVAASITYLAEHTAQPEAFASIPHALWWAVVTMTTIGYGDVVPLTLIGRICASVIGIISVGMVALPAGILASGFNEALHQRRRKYERLVDEVLEDGVIDSDEHRELRHLQEELGLTQHEAASILKAGYRKLNQSTEICTQCGKIVLITGPDDPDDGSVKRLSKFG
ncbi:MAG: ion transporter [Rhodospirillales bacterium]|nr:ion transporter [Rhodospirillales bacterium]